MDGWTCRRCLAVNDVAASECDRCELVRTVDPTPAQGPPVAPGEPPAPTDHPPVRAPTVNRLAVISLAIAVIGISVTAGFVLSLVLEPASPMVVAAVAGVVLAAVLGPLALLQIRRHRERGAGFAAATLVLTGAWILLIGAGTVISPTVDPEPPADEAAVAAPPPTTAAPSNETTTTTPRPLVGEPRRGLTGEIVGPGSVLVEQLEMGNCLKNPLGDSRLFFRVDVVPCKEMHRGEIYDVSVLPGGDWPGDDAIFLDAEERCSVALYELSPTEYSDPEVEIVFFHPTEVSWLSGDRTIQCLAEFGPPGRTGDISPPLPPARPEPSSREGI